MSTLFGGKVVVPLVPSVAATAADAANAAVAVGLTAIAIPSASEFRRPVVVARCPQSC